MTMSLATWALALLLAPQEKFPAEDDAWMRFKAGSSVTNKVVVHYADNVVESVQKLTLKEKTGDGYVVEETMIDNGQSQLGKTTRGSVGTITGKETLTVAGKEYPCLISSAKGKRDDGDTEYRFWMPKGNQYPLKVVFKQADGEGEVVAVAVDEKRKVGTREFLCAKLQGKVKFGEVSGVMTVWLSQEIPGAQAQLELTLQTGNGELKFEIAASEIHEEK